MMKSYVVMDWPLFGRLVACVPCVEEGNVKNAAPWLKDGWEKKNAVNGDVCTVCGLIILMSDEDREMIQKAVEDQGPVDFVAMMNVKRKKVVK
jgi:hypothetical protein